MAPRTNYPLPAQHLFTGLDAWRMLSQRAAAGPGAPFLTWHPFEGEVRTWSYGAFARDALGVAAGLRGRGVRAGDRVLIHLENCPEFLLAWFSLDADPAGPAGWWQPDRDESWALLLQADPEQVPARAPEPGAPMSVQYTSGTTSRPKGVVWTHANALWAARVNGAHEHLPAGSGTCRCGTGAPGRR